VPFSPLDPWIRTRNGTERPRRSARQPRDRSLSFILSSCSSLFSLDFQVQDTLMNESHSFPPSLPPVVLYSPFFFISSYFLGPHLPTQRHHHAAAVRSSFIFPFIHLHPSIPHRHLRGSCYFTKSRPNRKVAHVYIAAFVLIEDGIEEPFSFKSPVLSPHLSVRSFLSSRQSSGGTVVLTVSADPSLIISVDSPSSRLLSPLFFGRHAHLTAATLSTPYS